MGLFTKFLKLFTTTMETDGDDYFDFERDINEPLRIIDSEIGKLKEKQDFIPFCFNSGPVINGEPALLELSTVIETIPAEIEGGEPGQVEHKIITLKAPAVYTDGQGKTTAITEDLTLDVTNFEPGANYSLRVENIDGTVLFSALKGVKVYRQKTEPENPNPGDLWQNLSVAPELAYICTADNAWQITNQVEAGIYDVPANSGGGG